MKRNVAICLSIMAITLLCLGPANRSSQAKSDKFRQTSNPIPDRFIVVLEGELGGPVSEFVDARIDDLTAEYRGKVDKTFSDAIAGYSVEMTEAEARDLAEDSRVKYIEQDSYVSEAETVSSPGWALDRIDQRSLPFDNQYTYTSSGVGVHVYVIDSGILTTHQGLSGRASDDFDAVHDQYDPLTCNGHGTGVAGVVGSSNFGVARNVQLHSVRVFPCTGNAALSDVLSAVDWVTRHAIKPAVVNMSLRADLSQTLNSAVSASIRSGITYVVAAGNDGADACNYSPGSVREVITVGSTNSVDQRVNYSNFGTCVDLFAPGEGVATIWNSTVSMTTYASGTSFASPMVAGAAALFLQQNPLATPQQVADSLMADATTGVIADVGVGSPNMLLHEGVSSPSSGGCSAVSFSGVLNNSGAIDFKTDPTGFNGRTGAYSGTITPPEGTAISLSLEKKSKSAWSSVASSSGSSDLRVSYRGKSGTYRWRIESITGSGNYLLCSKTP